MKIYVVECLERGKYNDIFLLVGRRDPVILQASPVVAAIRFRREGVDLLTALGESSLKHICSGGKCIHWSSSELNAFSVPK